MRNSSINSSQRWPIFKGADHSASGPTAQASNARTKPDQTGRKRGMSGKLEYARGGVKASPVNAQGRRIVGTASVPGRLPCDAQPTGLLTVLADGDARGPNDPFVLPTPASVSASWIPAEPKQAGTQGKSGGLRGRLVDLETNPAPLGE